MSKQRNGTPGKKPPAPSVKLRLARTPLEQRSGSKPLARSAQRRSTVGEKADEVEAGQRAKPIPVRRGRGQKSEMTIGARRGEARMLGPSDGAGTITPSIKPNLSKCQSSSACASALSGRKMESPGIWRVGPLSGNQGAALRV